MADDLSRRINRIHAPSIDVVFRDDIQLTSQEVWREDDLYDSAGGCFRVLDFGVEERLSHRVGPEQEWAPSGRVLVEIQRLDPETGAGMSEGAFKEVAGEEGAVIAWYGWRLDPRSPRPPMLNDGKGYPDPIAAMDVAEVCLMCGSSDVIYHDADGTPRCKQHVGESPEEEDADG